MSDLSHLSSQDGLHDSIVSLSEASLKRIQSPWRIQSREKASVSHQEIENPCTLSKQNFFDCFFRHQTAYEKTGTAPNSWEACQHGALNPSSTGVVLRLQTLSLLSILTNRFQHTHKHEEETISINFPYIVKLCLGLMFEDEVYHYTGGTFCCVLHGTIF